MTPNKDVKFKISWLEDDGQYMVWRGRANWFETSSGWEEGLSFTFNVLGQSTMTKSDDPNIGRLTLAKGNPTYLEIKKFMDDNNIPSNVKIKTKKKSTEFVWND